MSISLLFALAALSATPCNSPEPASAHDIELATGALPKATDSFLVGRTTSQDAPPGTRIFVKSRNRWLACDALEFSGELVSDKRTKDGRRMLWGWHTSEGPGQVFDGVIYRPGAPLICMTADFSSVTNRNEATGEFDWTMEFLSFEDVNIDAAGRGVLVASGDLDIRGKEQHVTYAFHTRDGGRSWSRPVRIRHSYRPAGIYRP